MMQPPRFDAENGRYWLDLWRPRIDEYWRYWVEPGITSDRWHRFHERVLEDHPETFHDTFEALQEFKEFLKQKGEVL